MAVFLDSLRPHYLAVTTWIQVDQTCPVGYISSHLFIRRSFNDLNQLAASVMDTICKKYEGIVPSHGVTQQ